MSRFFSSARAADQVERRLDALAHVEGCASMSIRPASILEKSRMSLMIVSSASPESRMVWRSRAARRVERRVQQQPAHADHRVHRRADLVAHRRQEGALGVVGSFGGGAGPRLLRLAEHLAFWIAITAWSAKVSSRLSSFSDECGGWRTRIQSRQRPGPSQISAQRPPEVVPYEIDKSGRSHGAESASATHPGYGCAPLPA